MLKNALGLFILAIVVLLVFLPSYTRLQDLKQKNLDYKRQIEQLTKKNLELREEQKRLQEDPVYLEKIAREKMGLVKPGEVVYKIMPASSSNLNSQSAQKTKSQPVTVNKILIQKTQNPTTAVNKTPVATKAPGLKKNN